MNVSFETISQINLSHFQMVFCQCSKCVQNSVTNANGEQQNGRFISQRAFLPHRLAEYSQQVIQNHSARKNQSASLGINEDHSELPLKKTHPVGLSDTASDTIV
jgi:hypothetical protein